MLGFKIVFSLIFISKDINQFFDNINDLFTIEMFTNPNHKTLNFLQKNSSKKGRIKEYEKGGEKSKKT